MPQLHHYLSKRNVGIILKKVVVVVVYMLNDTGNADAVMSI